MDRKEVEIHDSVFDKNVTGYFGCKMFGSTDYLCLCDFDNCNDVFQEYLRLEFVNKYFFCLLIHQIKVIPMNY